MDISLVESIMENLGISQSKIDLNKTDKCIPLPENIIKKFNINSSNYTMYDFNNNDNTNPKVWTFYQSILYFLKKDYLLQSFNSMTKEYESFILKFKKEIERMCYVIDNNNEILTFEIDDKLLNILSRYLELKIVLLTNEEKIIIYPDNNSKNKKIVIFKNNDVYYPVADLRFQGYEFITDDIFSQQEIKFENKEETNILNESILNKMNKQELTNTANNYGIIITKVGKTKTVTKTKKELIIEILNHAHKK